MANMHTKKQVGGGSVNNVAFTMHVCHINILLSISIFATYLQGANFSNSVFSPRATGTCFFLDDFLNLANFINYLLKKSFRHHHMRTFREEYRSITAELVNVSCVRQRSWCSSFLPSFLPFYFRVCAFSIQRTRLSRSLEQAITAAVR